MLVRLPDRRLRLAFFGTPELAATVLEGLLDAGRDDVVLAVCQPDRPKGRGKTVEPPPVKVLAEARGVPVIQPTKLKDGAVAARLRDERLDLAIVAAYGRILPRAVLDGPAGGMWNVHASLLPRHRGASPINHAILDGDPETGVTLMQMTEGLDEGPMLLGRAFPIAPTATTATLTADLARVGRDLLLEGLAEAKRNGLTATPQDAALATHAGILEKEHGHLDFTHPAAALERRVRALDPWPGTFVLREDGPLRILRARVVPAGSPAPGTVLEAGPRLVVATSDQALEVVELQPPGKRPMPAADWLRGAGRHLRPGDPLENARPPASA